MFGFRHRQANPGSPQSTEAAHIRLETLLAQRGPARHLPLAAWRKLLGPQGEQHPSRLRGRGVDLAEIRHYQPGDDIRTIDWNITARSQKPHTKVFQEERERPVLLLVDQSPAMFFGSRHECKSVTAARAAALLGWAALHNRDQVGGLIYGADQQAFIKPRRSRHTLLHLLGTLAQYNRALERPAPPPAGQLSQILARLQPTVHPGSLVFVISDFLSLDETALQHLHRLARHSDIIGIHIYDPLEQTLPEASCLPLTDGQRTLAFSACDAEQQRHYQDRFAQHLDFVQRRLHQLRIPVMLLGTQDDLLVRLREGLGMTRH